MGGKTHLIRSGKEGGMAMNVLALNEFLRQALQEDIGFGDITSEAIFAEDHFSSGYVLAKQDFVLAGLSVFQQVFQLLDPTVKIQSSEQDGSFIEAGSQFIQFSGRTRSLLTGERVALNLLQHLSGIATKTHRFAAKLQGSSTVIADTRKTTPGMRMLEKYAVKVGGGKNHRLGLDHMILIKDNHIRAAGSIGLAVAKVRAYSSPFIKIEVETESLEQVQDALDVSVDVIMLDNMCLQDIQQAVKLIHKQALIEVSGNVTLARMDELAAAGVDIISSGALTHSVEAVDISMKFD